jgi:hypothetical protein
LEKWATSSKRQNFIDSNVGPPGILPNFAAEDFLRNFDTVNLTITFRGDVYHLQPIANAIQDLWQKAAIEAQKPY